MTRLLILGGSDAGISAALRARELDASTEVTVVLADRFPNYSICGLPFYLSGEVPDWHALAHRTAEDIAREGIHLLRWMEEAFAVHQYLDTHAPRSAVIVGGGYIGMEMADAFVRRGLSVTVVEHGPSVLKTVDESFGTRVEAQLRQHGVQVATGVAAGRIDQDGSRLRVTGPQGFEASADLVLVAVSVRPQTALAEAAYIVTGERQAIRVTRAMETNVPDIYAAGA